MADSNKSTSQEKNKIESNPKKKWDRPELSQLDTTHTNGGTPIKPGDAGLLKS